MSTAIASTPPPPSPAALRALSQNQVRSGEPDTGTATGPVETSELTPAAQSAINGANLTTPDQEAAALSALQNGQVFNRAHSGQGAFQNFTDAVKAYMNPSADADPARKQFGTMLAQKFANYQGAGTPQQVMSNFMGTMGSDQFGNMIKGMPAGSPVAGPLANLHALASESAAYGAPQ